MIVPMTKYSLVMYHGDYDRFLEQLQELGLVDITIRDMEADDDQRQLLLEIERLRNASTRLRAIIKSEGYKTQEGFGSGEEAFAQYSDAAARIDSLSAMLAKARREAEELKIWGEFSPERIAKLEAEGIYLHYFMAYNKEFDSNIESWKEEFNVEEIFRDSTSTYFVVITGAGQTVQINAQEVKAPTATTEQRRKEAEDMEAEIESLKLVLAKAAANVEDIERIEKERKATMQLSRVSGSCTKEAEDTLYLLEGFATKESAEKVDKFLESTDVFYLKEDPKPEDNVPVLLKNNKFSRPFELIGQFYTLPKYGSLDLTPFFAPFYMIFFGFCLCDGGYGLIFLIAGMLMRLKGGKMLKDVGTLTLWCGSATVLFGILTGSFFGVSLAGFEAFREFRDYFLDPNKLFSLAIAVGMIQILFGMALKVVNLTIQFGFRYSLSTIGWMLVIIASIAAMFLPDMGVPSFSMHSTAYYIIVGIGLFMMLCLHNPAKNILVNIGPGLWNTYNDVTGLLGDLLSYIRLFALGLAGSVLALVFNDLAIGMSPDIPGVRELVMILILIIGHGINIFMSSLGSFVHPMRLTFVEFYKNAGFESSQRAFNPLKK